MHIIRLFWLTIWWDGLNTKLALHIMDHFLACFLRPTRDYHGGIYGTDQCVEKGRKLSVCMRENRLFFGLFRIIWMHVSPPPDTKWVCIHPVLITPKNWFPTHRLFSAALLLVLVVSQPRSIFHILMPYTVQLVNLIKIQLAKLQVICNMQAGQQSRIILHNHGHAFWGKTSNYLASY